MICPSTWQGQHGEPPLPRVTLPVLVGHGGGGEGGGGRGRSRGGEGGGREDGLAVLPAAPVQQEAHVATAEKGGAYLQRSLAFVQDAAFQKIICLTNKWK